MPSPNSPSFQPDGFSRCEKHMPLTSIFDIPSTWPPAFGRVLSSSGSPNFGRVHFDSWWRGEVGTSVSACAAPFVLFHTSPMMTKCWKNSELKHSTFPHQRTILSGFHWHCFVFYPFVGLTLVPVLGHMVPEVPLLKAKGKKSLKSKR